MRPYLIKARKNKDLTQAQLGVLVGRTAQTICDLEKGRNGGSVEVWDKLAAALKVKADKLRQIGLR